MKNKSDIYFLVSLKTEKLLLKTMSTVRLILAFIATLVLTNSLVAQEQTYKLGLVGFYNVENLFDTIDTPDVRDTEFSPKGSKNYDADLYQDKLGNLSKVLSEIGTDLSPDGLSMFGVAEIENRSVLEDLIAQPKLKDRNYQIVHYDSPDKRGIDVGFVYNPKYFTVTESRNVPLTIFEADDTTRIYTRDILLAGGKFDGKVIYLMVNHLTSLPGGQFRSARLREAGD